MSDGKGGSSTKTETVTVDVPSGGGGGGGDATAPTITTFTADPTSITSGQTATLSWAITGAATEVTISPGVGNVTADADKKVTVKPTSTTTYTINAKNGTATASPKTATVTVTGSGGGTTPPYVLTLNKSGTGEGSVTSEPEGINCGDDCSSDTGTYNANVVVTLTAEEAEGSTFAGWSGACTNATGACEVTMDSAKNVTATFTQSNTTPEPSLDVLSATYNTNFSADGVAVICDNRTTTLTYRFSYQGPLENWTSYLEGQTFKEIKGERTFDPDSEGVIEVGEGGFEVQYVMSPNFAPYGQKGKALLQGAIAPLQMPVQIGATRLHLMLKGAGQEAKFVSQNIPVVNNCP